MTLLATKIQAWHDVVKKEYFVQRTSSSGNFSRSSGQVLSNEGSGQTLLSSQLFQDLGKAGYQ